MPRTFFVTALLLITCLLSTPALAREVCLPPDLTPCTPAVLDAVQIVEDTPGFAVDIDYPVLCAAPANRVIRDYVTTVLADFKKDFPEHDRSAYPHKHTMDVRYAAWTALGERVVSVKLHTTVFSGGAHPNNWPETWVFDLGDGHPLALDDIFVNVRDALAVIAPMVRETLAASLGRMNQPDMLADGTLPTAANYQDFILTDEGVAFFFAPYQVAPYAAGEQVVTLPYATLGELLRPAILAAIK